MKLGQHHKGSTGGNLWDYTSLKSTPKSTVLVKPSKPNSSEALQAKKHWNDDLWTVVNIFFKLIKGTFYNEQSSWLKLFEDGKATMHKNAGKTTKDRMKETSKNRLTDGCLEEDEGTQQQVGCIRLWFPDSPLKGLTSDTLPQTPPLFPCCVQSEHFPFPACTLRCAVLASVRLRRDERRAKTAEPRGVRREDERQTDPRAALMADNWEQQPRIKKDVPKVQRWSLLQRMSEMRCKTDYG